MCKVTIVDDCKELRTSLARLLSEEGYAVSVHDGKEGVLRHIQQEKPDILILDYMLGGRTGADIAKRLRTDALSDAAILALSAHPSAQLSMAHEQVFAFLQKPVSADTLLEKLTQLTARRATLPAGIRT